MKQKWTKNTRYGIRFDIAPSLAGDLRIFIDLYGNSNVSIPYRNRKKLAAALIDAAHWISAHRGVRVTCALERYMRLQRRDSSYDLRDE